MKLPFDKKTRYLLPVRIIVIVGVFLSIIAVANSAFIDGTKLEGNREENAVRKKDSIESVEAFAQVYTVLMHPRCMNCHPKGDVPLQGDDSHLHTMAPKRGSDGH